MVAIRAMIKRHPGRWAVAGLLALAGAVFVVVWFEPQALFIDNTVDEGLPSMGEGADDATGADAPSGAGAVTLASNDFIGLAHGVEGRAVVLELPDGSRFLRFEDFEVSNGPDLRVYVSAATPDSDSSTFDDDFVDLGDLKGNIGNQNYMLPADLDLGEYPSVVVWCRRFSTGFAVAGLN